MEPVYITYTLHATNYDISNHINYLSLITKAAMLIRELSLRLQLYHYLVQATSRQLYA